MISETTIRKVRELAIEDVLSPYVRLSRKGSTLMGLCPFHSEKTGSFAVTPSKNLFHCFSCNQTSVSNDQHMALSFSYIITMLSYSYINTWKYHLQGKNTIFFSYSKFFCKKLLQSVFFVLLCNHKQRKNVLQIVYCTKLPYHIMKVRNEEVVHGIHT